MGLIQNKVTVSQPNSHVVVKNAGGLRGLTGETGPQGPQGVPGEAATVTAGTTTTLPAGSNATVQNVGSTSAAIFNFGIPKGDKGDTGETGAAATISVGTTTTLEPGEDATVTNTGTSSAAVFDFGIPKGAKGDTGSQGPAGQDGADGFSPTATVTKTGDTATITITDKDGTTTAQISDGVTPTIDPALSPTSENPVQNKVVTNALAGKADKPIFVSSLPSTGTAGQEYFVDDRYNTVTELKGDTEQTTYSGKNLLLPSPRSSVSSGLTASYDAATGVITLSGTANNNWSNAFNDVSVNLPAGTYTFSATTEAGLGRNIIFFNGTTNILQKTLGDNDTSVECVVPQNATSVRLWLTTTNGTNYTGKTFKAQLEAGNQASSFEPYVGGIASPNPDYPQTIHTVSGEQTITISDGNSQSREYEVNLGKNLFDNSAVQIKTNATFTGTDGNVFTTSSSDYRDLAIVKVQPNTKLTFSINDTSTYPNTRLYVVGLRNTTTESGESFDWLSGTSTITTGNNTNYLGVIIQPRDSSNNTPVQTQEIVDSLKIQLEFGSVKTTYAPYFTPIELCKIGTYQDYIYKSGDDWYVHKETKKVNLYDTKDLPWWKSVSTVKINWTLLGMDDIQPAASKSVAGVMMSDHFTNTYANALVNGLTNVGCAVGDDGIYFSNNGWDAATFKTYITNNIVLCYFALKNATDTQITDATLITQLEALAGAKIMVDGGTATVTSQYLPATLATAFNSNSGYIDYIYDGTNFVKVR